MGRKSEINFLHFMYGSSYEWIRYEEINKIYLIKKRKCKLCYNKNNKYIGEKYG